MPKCHLRLYLVFLVTHNLESPFSGAEYSYYTACILELLLRSHSINVPTETGGLITFHYHDWLVHNNSNVVCLCVQGVTCTTISLNMECSVKKKCASMLLKSSWAWSICTTALSFIGTSRYSRPMLTVINSNLMEAVRSVLFCSVLVHTG